MLMVGTLVNMIISGAVLVAYANDVPGWLAFLIFLLPLPYNISLCMLVWRSAARNKSGWSDLARLTFLVA